MTLFHHPAQGFDDGLGRRLIRALVRLLLRLERKVAARPSGTTPPTPAVPDLMQTEDRAMAARVEMLQRFLESQSAARSPAPQPRRLHRVGGGRPGSV